MEIAIRAPIPGVRDTVSAEEWELRVQLAACFRLVALQGWNASVHNNITARVPGEVDAFLVNPLDLLYEEITASSLVKVDGQGRILFNPDPSFKASLAGFAAHSAIHRARPDLACLIHTHSIAGMAISALDCGFVALHQSMLRFREIAYHAFEGMAIDDNERKRLGERMIRADVMVLRHHGLLAGGRNIPEAFNNIRRMEHAAAAQMMAAACAGVGPIPPAVIERTRQQLADGDSARRLAGGPFDSMAREWAALLRQLDRLDPEFRQ